MIDWKLSKELYPTTETPPRFYGLPKVHKADMPLRPIVSSIGSIMYTSAKYLSKVLSPLVGKNKHFIKNSKHFASEMKNKRVEEDEILISYDVTALFTSVPVQKAITVIHDKLLTDDTLHERTPLSAEHITKLLEICLKCTYFTYDEAFYAQIHGAAMGSPVSPIVCNLYMEHFESIALSTAPHPPGWWYRYVDDTHTKQKVAHVQEFTEHINKLDPDIKFTIEREENGSLAFLDTNTVRRTDGTISTTVYRKPTHTDQYLDFESCHPEEHKMSVIRSLHQRAGAIISDPTELTKEIKHVNDALKKCHYPDWALKKTEKSIANPNKSKGKKRYNKADQKGSVVMPYVKGTSETLRRIFNKHKVNVCFKPHQTLKQMLVHPKDKTKKSEVCGAIYHVQCAGSDKGSVCNDSYIGETERTLKKRFLEHRRPSSSTSEVSKHIHVDSPDHSVSLDRVEVLDREASWFERGVKEAIHIRTRRPTLNKDGGRHNLPHIWDPVLKPLTEGNLDRR